LRCIKCGADCCPTCAYSLEAATYCTRCAGSVLDTEGIPRGASVPVSWVWAPDAAPPDRPASGDKGHWIILVARDQPDLLAHLARAFARDNKVEVIMDRRKDYSRNPPGMEDRLRTHGAAVIKRRAGD
jgi:hypothetical protein